MKTKIAKKNSQRKINTPDSRSEVLVGWEFSHPARPIGFHVAPQAAPSRRRRPLKLKLDGHGCVIAGTGAGKSRSCVIPALLNPSNRTVVCVDVKGELVNVTRRFREQLGPVITSLILLISSRKTPPASIPSTPSASIPRTFSIRP